MSDTATQEAEIARNEQIVGAMAAAGQVTETPVPVDYFGFEETHTVTLPDGVSWVQHKTLNEGARRKYLNMTNRDVTLQKVTGDAKIRMQPGEERRNLLKSAITAWNLTRGGQPVPCTDKSIEDFLEKANPAIIDIIEKDVRAKNKWLGADVTIEDIDKTIAELQTQREQMVKDQEGKVS